MAKRKSVAAARKQDTKESGPAYMVQVADPVSLRRDLLESLREIIIFIQGYERFRKIQEEKVATFTQLKADVKELNSLLDYQLRRFFPKGKLPVALPQQRPEQPKREEAPRVAAASAPVAEKPSSELDELEAQLKDIENQLQGIK